MKIILIYSGSSARTTEISQTMKKCWSNSGTEVTLLDVDQQQSCGVSWSFFKGADLLVFGSAVMGLAGGFSSNLENFIKNTPYIEGKRVAVFVAGGFIGKDKALKSMMELLEKQGAFVFDFQEVNRIDEAEKLADRLNAAGISMEGNTP